MGENTHTHTQTNTHAHTYTQNKLEWSGHRGSPVVASRGRHVLLCQCVHLKVLGKSVGG